MPDDGGDGGCGCGPTRPGHPAAGLLAGLALLLALLWRRTGQRAKGCCPIVKDSRGA
jgi:MYXO-CTERM domain-containing protein